MASYLVAYDLVKEKEHDYQKLWDELARIGAHRTQFSLWLVSATLGARELHDALKSYMHEQDRLWVAEFSKNRHWFSNAMSGTNKWIQAHPPRQCT